MTWNGYPISVKTRYSQVHPRLRLAATNQGGRATKNCQKFKIAFYPGKGLLKLGLFKPPPNYRISQNRVVLCMLVCAATTQNILGSCGACIGIRPEIWPVRQFNRLGSNLIPEELGLHPDKPTVHFPHGARDGNIQLEA